MTIAHENSLTVAEQDILSMSPFRDGVTANSFLKMGLPHNRIEAYRYTDLKRLITHVPPLVTHDNVNNIYASLLPFTCHEVHLKADEVEVNDLPANIRYETDVKNDISIDSFNISMLNQLFVRSEKYIFIGETPDASLPISIRHHLSKEQPASHHHHLNIILGQNAKATIVEIFDEGVNDDFCTSRLDITLHENAQLTHIIVNGASQRNCMLSSCEVTLKKAADYQQYILCQNASLSRVENHIHFDDISAQAALYGLMLAQKDSHLDCTTTINHRIGYCQSKTNFRSLAREGGKTVFQGKISVAEHAQKTDAQMLSKGYFLDDVAEIINKPELEIYADDVVCAHGATSGTFDEGAIFYLQSRGIDKEQAEAMLAMGVAHEVFESLSEQLPDIAVWLKEYVDNWLSDSSTKQQESQ